MFDLGKAVVASKDDEIKTQTKRLMLRAVAGVVIFFIPSIVMWIFMAVGDYKANESQMEICKDCILTPGKCPVP